jgi:tetratricopeptide (TPR) repeat protein
MYLNRLVPLLVGFLVLAPTELAWARDKVDKKLEKEAHKHTKTGLKYLKVGKLDAGIGELQIAYGLAKDPEILFHLAEAYNEKKDYAQALYYYKAFRDADAKAAKQRNVDDVIAALEELNKPAEPPPEAKPEPPPEPEVVKPEPAPAPEPAPPPPAAPVMTPPPAPPADSGAGGGMRVTGLITGASGVVLIGVGVYFGKVAADRSDEVSQVFAEHGTWNPSLMDAYDEGQSAQTTAIVLGAVGGAALVTGSVLYYLGWREREHAHVQVSTSGKNWAVGWSCEF